MQILASLPIVDLFAATTAESSDVPSDEVVSFVEFFAPEVAESAANVTMSVPLPVEPVVHANQQVIPIAPTEIDVELGVTVNEAEPLVQIERVVAEKTFAIAPTTTLLAPVISAVEPDARPIVIPALTEPTAPLEQTSAQTPKQSETLSQRVMTQVSAQIATLTEGVTEILLDPEELGRIKLQLTSVDNVAQVHFEAERPETAELVRRHVETLLSEFEAMGFEGVNLTFGEHAEQDQQHTAAHFSHENEREEPDEIFVPDGVDIRL